MNCISRFYLVLAMFACTLSVPSWADEVTEWNRNMLQAGFAAKTPPMVMTRVAAIVQAAVFDAVNGIERRYTAIHVEPAAARGASRRAAAVQAAYGTLVKLYPAQKISLDEELASSLAAISSDDAEENSVSIARGIQWGQTVADAIWAWRSTDGFTPPPPPFMGGLAVGEWRPTPPGFLPGAVPQFATMTPWKMQSPSQFRPPGPPALDSERYTADFNETKSMGSINSPVRTADQTLASLFWASSNANYLWNHVAVSLGAERHTTLSENARLLALLNIAIADANIAGWDAKYYYAFWRPVTAIGLAASDGNPATTEDPDWRPLLATPPFPEYVSAHSIYSSAATTVLAHYFGEETSFDMDSDGMPGVVRTFQNFGAALEELNNARIFAGIHFRSACEDGQAAGTAVADYVIAHSLQRIY